MKQFDKSADFYAAGYALPWYSVECATRAWRHKDNIFTTPIDVPVERVILADRPVAALLMESFKNERT
jgi:hypothetical protein